MANLDRDISSTHTPRQRGVLSEFDSDERGNLTLLVALRLACMRVSLFTLLLAAYPGVAQMPRTSVDPRVELLSIVFHLAGNSEYNQCRVSAYCEDIDKYFTPYKDDAAIRIARELRASRGISYDAVMSMAIHLRDVETLSERVSLDAPDTRLEKRWQA